MIYKDESILKDPNGWNYRVQFSHKGYSILSKDHPEISKWATETFGKPAVTSDYTHCRWYPCWNDIYFQDEADAMLFLLKWKQ